ncbi:MAG: DUF5329 domain-containing protein [Desulfobacterales bacterium]|jgi:hypothetical protein
MRRWSALGLIILMTFLMPGMVVADSDNTDREIQHLMAYIAGAECRFIRNGKEYSPEAARNHIQKKYEYALNRIKMTEDFIQGIASRSSISGTPYKVRCNDQIMLCADWLGAELQRFRQKEQAGGP